jgi:predicted transcriptional regulator
MTIFAPEMPSVRRLILRLLADNGGNFEGSEQLCQAIPADRSTVYWNLRKAHKYHLIRRSKNGSCGRGHKSIWILTKKGWSYVKP